MGGAILPRKGPRTRMRMVAFAVIDIYKVIRILRLTNPPPDVQETIKQKTQEFARRGFRTLGKLSLMLTKRPTDWSTWCSHLGVACKENGGDWKFLGLLPMCVAILSLISTRS
jgi:hypothetical protein